MKALEQVRIQGRIGSSLQAEVQITCSGAMGDALGALGDDLRFVLMTSAARVLRVDGNAALAVGVTRSLHPKCERCWHHVASVGTHAQHPTLCGRCIDNLEGPGETRLTA